MRAAMSQLNLLAHTYHRILKLSCTLADLAGQPFTSFLFNFPLENPPKPAMIVCD